MLLVTYNSYHSLPLILLFLSISFFKLIFFFFIVAALRLPLAALSGGYSPVAVCRLLIAVVSLAEHRL